MIYLKSRVTEKETKEKKKRKREEREVGDLSSSPWSTSQTAAMASVRPAEGRNLEFHQGLPSRRQKTKHLGLFCCFPRH